MSILGELDPDIWYDFGDFVQDIKKNHYNLILDHTRRDRYNKENFYHTFTEYQSPEGRYHAHSSSREISDTMADAFERVEGRYLAYFLEDIPCLMGYVALAKVSPENTNEAFPFPEYNTIKGFCLTPKGKAVLSNDRAYGFHREFKLLPNYDIHLHMPDFSETIVFTLEKIAPLKTFKKNRPHWKRPVQLSRIVEIPDRIAARPSVATFPDSITESLRG